MPLPASRITLKCTKCKRKISAERDDTDPPNAVRMETECDRCDRGGGWPETFYYDAENNQIDCDGNILPPINS